MFSGIIEATGRVVKTQVSGSNLDITIEAPFTQELKIDQSIAHNGACLTVVSIEENTYRVTAIKETLEKTNLSSWKNDDEINLERCLKLGDRLDGHMVQGHVDAVAKCTGVVEEGGSWKFSFSYPKAEGRITVPKGSICVNGVSLTVVDSATDGFSVCIIPYTFEHTNFHRIRPGDLVNLEFDVIGKYVMQYLKLQVN